MKGRAQWRIQGRDRGAPTPPPHPHLLLDQTVDRKAEIKIFKTTPPPPLSYGLDDRPPPPPPLSEGLDPPLACTCVVRASLACTCVVRAS